MDRETSKSEKGLLNLYKPPKEIHFKQWENFIRGLVSKFSAKDGEGLI